jgi:hypothetical protein
MHFFHEKKEEKRNKMHTLLFKVLKKFNLLTYRLFKTDYLSHISTSWIE